MQALAVMEEPREAWADEVRSRHRPDARLARLRLAAARGEVDVDAVAADALWAYPQPIPEAPPLGEYVAFRWDAMDRWLEEDEEVHVHVRDPYTRVDILATSRAVRVELEGVVLAESTHARVLFETGLPPRWYLPTADVRADRLVPCPGVRTGCPYKGEADYHSVRLDDHEELALVWTYTRPRREVEPIAGRLCFFNERVDLELDGELQERPRTQWSTDEWARGG